MSEILSSRWFWDIAIIVVLLLYVLIKASKGFFECIIPVVILAVSIVGAYIVTPIIEPSVEAKLMPLVISKVQSKIEDIDISSILGDAIDKLTGKSDSKSSNGAEASQTGSAITAAAEAFKESIKGKSISDLTSEELDFIDSIKEQLPESVENLASEYGIDITETIVDNIDSIGLGDSIKTQVSGIVTSVATKVASKVIYTGCFIVMVLVIMIILNIVKALINPLLKEAPVVSQVNKAAGAILGLIEGLLVVYIVVNILYLFNAFKLTVVAQDTILLKLFLSVSPAEILSAVTTTLE